MSKVIKQMQMDALKQTFSGVKNFVFLSQSSLGAIAENQLRLSLRKKKVRLQLVKNSLARKVFDQMGLQLKDVWTGNTVIAWGGGESIKDLSREIEAAFKEQTKKDPKFNERVTIKTALADGEQVTFAAALKMPTRLEAIGDVVRAMLAPGAALAGALAGPGGQVASQIESKTKDGANAA
jgi:large subunit ribosomal protein L10